MEWDTAQYELSAAASQVALGDVHMYHQRALAKRFAVSTAPTTLVFSGGSHVVFDGTRTADSIVASAALAVSKLPAAPYDGTQPVATLDEAQLDAYVSGRPSDAWVVLFSKRWPPPPTLAQTVPGVRIGFVRITAPLAKRFKLTAASALLGFPAAANASCSATEWRSQVGRLGVRSAPDGEAEMVSVAAPSDVLVGTIQAGWLAVAAETSTYVRQVAATGELLIRPLSERTHVAAPSGTVGSEGALREFGLAQIG